MTKNNGGYIDVDDFFPDASGGGFNPFTKLMNKLPSIPRTRQAQQSQSSQPPLTQQPPTQQPELTQPLPQQSPPPSDCDRELAAIKAELDDEKRGFVSLNQIYGELHSKYTLLSEEKDESNIWREFIIDWLLLPYIVIGIILLASNLYYTYLHANNYRKVEKLEYKYSMRKLSTEYPIIILYILPIIGYCTYYTEYTYMWIILAIIVVKIIAIAAGFGGNKHNVDIKYFLTN